MMHVYAELKNTKKHFPDTVSERQALYFQLPKLNREAILLFLCTGFKEK
jgi:hypothetical protein